MSLLYIFILLTFATFLTAVFCCPRVRVYFHVNVCYCCSFVGVYCCHFDMHEKAEAAAIAVGKGGVAHRACDTLHRKPMLRGIYFCFCLF